MAVTPPLPLTHFDSPDYEEIFETGEPEPGETYFTSNKMYEWDPVAGEYVEKNLPF